MPHDSGTTDAFVVSTQRASLVDTSKPNTSAVRPSAPRSDPRRKQHDTIAQPQPPSIMANIASSTNVPTSHQLDTKAVHSSDWYKDLSSKHKIMVNQQMAIVAAELRKFHNDTSVNKIFDLTFVRQNQMLQQVLTQLGTYIDENGQFVKIDESPVDNGANQNRQTFDEYTNPPSHQMDFVRPPSAMQQQQHDNFQSDSTSGGSFGVRPGLLGLAPPMHSGGIGNEYNRQCENAANVSGGYDNNNSGYTNPFNPAMYAGRQNALSTQQQQSQPHQQSGGAQFSRNGNNHRWGNQSRNNTSNNRRGFENKN